MTEDVPQQTAEKFACLIVNGFELVQFVAKLCDGGVEFFGIHRLPH